MKTGHAKHIVLVMLCAVSIILFGTIGVSALEVTPEVKEISIPVSVAADSPIAGAEAEFSWTQGLEYVKFVPAQGIENPIEADRSGKHYAGFFSDSNKFKPANGSVLMGAFVFKYTSANTETITFSETRAHTLNGSSVDSKVVGQNTKITVKRTGSTDPGTGNGDGTGIGTDTGTGSDANTGTDEGANTGTGEGTNTGNSGGTNTAAGGGTSTVVLPTASGTTASGRAQELLVLADQLARGVIPEGAVSGDGNTDENAAVNGGAQIGDGSVPSGAGANAEIGSGRTPLTALGGAEASKASVLLWVIIILVVVVVLLLFLLGRRRERRANR